MNTLLLLDRDDVGRHFRTFLENNGHKAELCLTATEAIERIRQGLGEIDVVFLHKDLGQPHMEWHINSDMAATEILEEAPHIRLVVVSGEYPDGEQHVKQLRADSYCNVLDLIDFGLRQVEKGMVSKKDQLLRGSRIEMPPRFRGLEKF